MIIYLSGPMRGLPDNNYPLFNKWAKYFRDRGHQVLNPAENDNGSKDKPFSFYMELDISNLLVCDTVVLLPDFQYSTGSKIEITIAQSIGRKIYLLEEFIKPRPKEFEPRITIDIV